MKNRDALRIAITSFQEFRILLHQGKDHQASEIAKAVSNLPLDESNKTQAAYTEKAILAYLSNYPERRELSHWNELLLMGILPAPKYRQPKALIKSGLNIEKIS